VLGQLWRRRIAAGTAAVVGVVLVMMGGGHLYAVISVALAEGRPLDYRLVSLIATGGIVACPGLLNLSVCKWLWQGRGWAYAMCIASEAACLVYLVLLVLVRARDPGGVANVGGELEAATILVGAHLVTLVWVGFLGTRWT
jgi:hypothetical protein